MASDIVFIVFALCFSAFIKGALGLGFSTICLAILANVLDLKVAISIVLIPSVLSNLIVMYSVGHFRISVQQFWPMLLATLFGMLIGLLILTKTDNTLSKGLLGAVLVIYGIWSYFNKTFRVKNSLINTLNPPVGFFTGMVNGSTGSQIFPVMPYLLSLNISKEVLLQTINLSFTLCSIIMLLTLWKIDAFDSHAAIKYSLGIFPVAAGVWLGGNLRKKLSDHRFRQTTMLLIIMLGFGLLFKVLS